MNLITGDEMRYFTIFLIVFLFNNGYSQERIPSEYVSPEGKISLDSRTPFNIAIQALSEVSGRLEGKLIIDPMKRTSPINVNIENLEWRKALELITIVNNLRYEEYSNYILIISEERKKKKEESPEEIYTSSSREVKISAVFFDADRKKMRERGINWNFFKMKGDISSSFQQNVVGGALPEDIFNFQVSKATGKMEISTLLKMFETENIGKIIATPQITVLDGKEGKVQVGQDFSIKQRDFAGNVTDNFVSSGIILTVTPTVIKEDDFEFVHLNVKAEKSSVTPGAISTVVNKIMAKTSLLLSSGEETAIAGLYSTENSIERKGIPGLKDLPWWVLGIRYLTGYNSKSTSEKELVISLKAEILPDVHSRAFRKSGFERDVIKEKLKEMRLRAKNKGDN
ncbi:hypothetical protein DRQ09_00925 [candidate division KSB1 bacterium]|nr:MAG: hypothetical protein DRQ09_00925 [candidate division KSB1 bacterium]